MRGLAAAGALGWLGVAVAAPAAAQNVPDLVSHDKLRVCADPGFLPFSNDRGEGFENRIAELLAKSLGLPIAYTWYPETSGFLRNTLFAQRCDVVMGINSGGGEVATTPAYYHTGYMIVTRAADNIDATAVDDPALAALRFGVVAATPPSDLLVAHDLIPHTTIYQLVVDTRHESPPAQMMQDLADGKIDVGLVWGPFAGWAITHGGLKLHAAFLKPEPGHPLLDYAIAMGVRPSDTEWAHRINVAAQAHRAEIDHILVEYGVPLLDGQKRPISLPTPPPPGSAGPVAAPAGEIVAEPAGYRMDQYRGPTPETVPGGSVIDTAALQALQQHGGAVLVDVLPAPRRPPEMKEGTPWSPLREDIPGSVWLPEVGQGALSPIMQSWFRTQLNDLTHGDADRPVVFYCLDQCWMSWNAAKRAASYGWHHVLWYRGGTDGWSAAGLSLTRATPQSPPQ